MATPHMQQTHMQQPGMYPQGQPQPQQRPANNLEQQKLMYQMTLQSQLQQRNLMAAQRTNMPPNANPMTKQAMPGPNGQFAGMRPQQQGTPQQARGGTNPENFMKSLATFMQTKNLPLDPNPIVGDRSISLMTLYMTVVKFGGFKKVTAQNGWGQVAQALQFHPMQHQNAPAQLRGHYERNLVLFEEAWQLNQQRQRAAMMQQNPNLGGPGPQMSPTKQMNPQAAMQQSQNFLQQQQQQLMAQQPHHQQHPQTTPVKQMAVMHPQQPPVNGFSTPQPQGLPHAMGPQSHARNSVPRNIDATPPQNGAPVPSPMSVKPGGLTVPPPLHNPVPQAAITPPQPQEYNLSEVLNPKVRHLDTWGGIDLDSLEKLGKAFAQQKPDIPAVFDLGVMDIHALSMSLQCGLHSEVRLALDTLATMSVEPRIQLDLRACEDLVETLVDCAEMQVELLAENAAEVSDVMLINSYEDVVRGSRCEQEVLQDIPVFGSLEYELDRAVDKLICITTIMRNLSFYEMNHALLADELVIKFLCVVIRYLGTRNMLLRTHQNTLDFMKDVIIFLSNLAQAVELPGREQALCLLHFLLAFAPCPPPNVTGERVAFSSYDPAIHRYLPPAVDSLAKLLARDEPNRSHYKTIFASDVASSPPYDLLTRTFGLAISPIPEDKQEAKRTNLMPVTEARKPFLMQGMLAAEILSNLAPGYETGVAKSWLTSEDGFSQNLCRLVLLLCLETSPPPPGGQHQRSQPAPKGVEDEALLRITMGGIAVLRRLAEKSRNPEDPNSVVPFSGLPPKEALFAALKIVQPRLQGVLKQLCAYAVLST
jgi:SWI/SNF chromatin-remodeling complex subunit SWI1